MDRTDRWQRIGMKKGTKPAMNYAIVTHIPGRMDRDLLFAFSAASSAYHTVSEIFPLEARGLAIAFFFAVGTAIGGIIAPWVFGSLIGSGSRLHLLYGYLVAAALMLLAAAIEALIGVKAERQGLEKPAVPLSVAEAAG
jgi:MFS family permease